MFSQAGIGSKVKLEEKFEEIKNDPSSEKFWLGHTYKRWNSYLWYSPEEYISQLNIPSLFITGSEDKSSPPEAVEYLRGKLKGRDSFKLQIIPGLDHNFNDQEGKNKIIDIINTVIIPFLKEGEGYYTLILESARQYKLGNYKISGELYEKAFSKGTDNSNKNYYYPAACSWAMAGKIDPAFKNLTDAIEKSWIDVSIIKEDISLQTLHQDKRWGGITEKIEKIEANWNLPLKEKLEKIYEEDQSYRKTIDFKNFDPNSPKTRVLLKQMAEHDQKLSEEVTEIIDEYGWPGKSLVGTRGSSGAFLVIQHSTPDIQDDYLPLLIEAAKKGEAQWSQVALLQDRILMYKGEKQIYGTQLRSNASGKLELYPIEDEENVDKRREEAGLIPLAEYLKIFNLNYKFDSQSE